MTQRGSVVIKTVFAFGMAMAIFPVNASARVTRFCEVAYETRLGWSDDVKTEVTFMTGRELNRATRTYDFEFYSNYALIWFAQGQVAIMRLDNITFGVGSEFDNEDFQRMFRLFGSSEAQQVNGDRPMKWRITAKKFLRFIDPRAE